MTPEQKVLATLKEHLAAGERALAAGDMVAYKACAVAEACTFDILRAMWKAKGQQP